MSTFSALTEWVKDMWPLPLVLAAAVRFVIAWFFSRRAALDRKQLDLEIARLRDEADRAERGRVHLMREIEKLMADFERQKRADSVAIRYIDMADRDRLSSGIGTAVSGCRFRADWFQPPPSSQ